MLPGDLLERLFRARFRSFDAGNQLAFDFASAYVLLHMKGVA